MKKLFLLAVTVFAISCSGDDGGSSTPECTLFVAGASMGCDADVCSYSLETYTDNIDETTSLPVDEATYEYYLDKVENLESDICYEGDVN